MTRDGGGAGTSLVRSLPARAGRWARRRPFTAALLVAITALSILLIARERTGFLLGSEGSLSEHPWWSFLPPMFAVGSVPQLIVVLLLVAVVVGEGERLMGTLRATVAYIGGGVLVGVLATAAGWLERRYLSFLPLNDDALYTLTPLAAITGTAFAATFFMGSLWRRRVRLGGLLAVAVLFLYGGSADDLSTLVAVPVGLLAGVVLGGRRNRSFIVRSSHHEIRLMLACAVAVGAVGPVIATVFGTGAGLLSFYGYLSFDPVVFLDGSACAFGSPTVPCPDEWSAYADPAPAAGLIALLPVLTALACARGILRGRRAALWIAGVLNAAICAWMTVQWLTIQPDTIALIAAYRGTESEAYVWQTLTGSLIAAAAPLAVVVALVVLRRHVRVRSSGRARRAFAVTVLGALAATLLSALAGQWAFRSGYRPEPGLGDILAGLPLRVVPPTLLPADILTFVPDTDAARLFWYLPPAIVWTALLVASSLLILSPASVAARDDRRRARALLRRGDGDSFSFMSTWPGNSYWFATGVEAAIAYRVRGNVAVTLGGPFGPDRDARTVLDRFSAFCGDNGWTPVFYSLEDDAARDLAARGWYRLRIADEALLAPQEWSTAGKKRQDIRTATNKAARERVEAVWTRWADLTAGQQRQLRVLSESWLADKDLPEMEFTLGGLDEAEDPDVRLMLAITSEGRIDAVTSWLPTFRDGVVVGYTLDVMRRRHEAINGVMEFVIGAAADRMKQDGVARMSLSGAPLAYTVADGEAEGDVVARVLRVAGTMLEPGYGFTSLHNYKRKFQPVFAPLWLVIPDPAALPIVGLALVRCYLPQLTVGQAARLTARLGRSRR